MNFILVSSIVKKLYPRVRKGHFPRRAGLGARLLLLVPIPQPIPGRKCETVLHAKRVRINLICKDGEITFILCQHDHVPNVAQVRMSELSALNLCILSAISEQLG